AHTLPLSFFLNMYAHYLDLHSFPTRRSSDLAVKPDSKLEQKHCNLAYAIQKVTEEIVIKMAKEAKRITGSDYLCMAGGVALNCEIGEHTSELQSRENLVCRLLLEKKKK